MPVTLVQTKSGNAGAYTNVNAQTFASNVSAGSLLVVGVIAGSADNVTSISDNRGNAYSLVDTVVPNDRKLWLYYAYNAVSGPTTITVNFDAFPDSVIIAREYSGATTSNPLDVSAKSTNASNYQQTHSTAASPATNQAAELVVVLGGNSGNTNPGYSAGATYGNLVTQNGFDIYTYGMMEDKRVTAAGSQTGTYSTTEFVIGGAILATFREVSTAVPARTFITYKPAWRS